MAETEFPVVDHFLLSPGFSHILSALAKNLKSYGEYP